MACWRPARRLARDVGLPGITQTPRELAFCHPAIAQAAVLEVPVAQADPRLCDHPLVTGQPGIRTS